MSPFPRPDYAALRRYDPERAPVRLDLSDNTNLWGPHPEALARAFIHHFCGVPSTNMVQVLVSSADVPSWAVIDTLVKKQSPSLTEIISVY